MYVIFDIDGTVRDNQPAALEAERRALLDLGCTISLAEQKEHRRYASEGDWKKYFSALNIAPEKVPEVVRRFYSHFEKLEPPSIIPGSREALEETESIVSLENMFFITNSERCDITKWFRLHNLEKYNPQLHTLITTGNQSICKGDTLVDLVGNSPAIFVGDAISDFDSCWQAFQKGAENLKFFGIEHEYSIFPGGLVQYQKENPDLKQILGAILPSIKDVPKKLHSFR